MTASEEDLVKSAQQGDRAAFEELVRRTSRLVFARLYLETGDGHRSEDLLQETYLKAFRSLRELADPRGFRSWLLRIAQNAVIDAARSNLRQKRAATLQPLDSASGHLAAREMPAEERVEREELRGQVLAILRSLPEEYRLPLTLRYIGGADYETICTQLGLTNGALRGFLHRGLKLMRAKLPPDFGNNLA